MDIDKIIQQIKSEKQQHPGKWTPDDDNLLRAAIAEIGEKNWKLIASMIPQKNATQCFHRWKKIIKPGFIKGPWMPGEDAKLLQWVSVAGPKLWTKCALYIPGRNGKQCRERWVFRLDPEISRQKWTAEEDDLIYKFYREIGPQWSTIATQVPGRTDDQIKNRFYSNQRKAINAAKKAEQPAPAPVMPIFEVEPTDEPIFTSNVVDNTIKQKFSTLADHVKSLGDILERTKIELSKKVKVYKKIAESPPPTSPTNILSFAQEF